MVLVKGAVISGQVANSEVFIAGRTVIITDFYMCDHPVTQGEYEKYSTYKWLGPRKDPEWYYNKTPGPTNSRGKGHNFPVYNVDWYDAVEYCNKRSIAEGLTPCYTSSNNTLLDTCNFKANGYRLPTEAEWEYAARGGNALSGKQYKYAGSDKKRKVAWTDDVTHKVKGKAPNALGLYDMTSNMNEWCWDWWAGITASTPKTGELHPVKGAMSEGFCRIVRGKVWAELSPLPSRSSALPSGICCNCDYNSIGFRVVRSAT